MNIKTRIGYRKTPVVVLTIDGVDIRTDGRFDEIINALCKVDGFFAIRGVASDPAVKAMIQLGLVNHSQGRGCYASPLLIKNKQKILTAYTNAIYAKNGNFNPDYFAMYEDG